MHTDDGAQASFGGAALFALALATTIVCAVAAWYVGGKPPFIGIDDAAITRNYAENIANGYGFVYYAGGERVEGATSFLWTLVVALAYYITPSPEFLVIGVCLSLAVIAVFSVLSCSALMAQRLGLPQTPVIALTVLGVAGMPAYFFWAVFSMMEIALWSATLLFLTWRLARLAERPKPWSMGVIAAAAILPLIRPEGAAAALGLLALAGVLMGRWPRGLLTAIGATVISAAALTGFRLVYFGYPVPNTFYAKVSSDRLQDVVDGAKYVFSFVTGYPFAEILLLVWAAAAIWALGRHFSARPEGARALLLAAATIVGIFAVYAMLGGDHFAYWRFLIPVVPLLAAAPALALTALVSSHVGGVWTRIATAAAAVVWLGVAYGDLRQARFDLGIEYALVERGLDFGGLLNEFEPQPSLGVGPAGGIALAYDGEIRDLLGLNWVEMAHANPVKVGMRNHASFDKETFWRHQPDLIGEFNRICERDAFTVHRTIKGVTKGLYLEPRFQETYTPLRIIDGDRCWRGFGRREWVAEAQDPRIEIVDWRDVTLLTSPTSG